MNDPVLNRTLLPANACFGCGLDNPRGLHIEVRRDPEDVSVVRATFVPQATATGFPGVVHGGALFTALDCLGTWTCCLLRPERGALWLLRSAETKYHRPSAPGRALELAGRIAEGGAEWQSVLVHAEARDPDGNLVVECRFKEVPLPVDKFLRVTGLDALPDNWRAFLGNLER